MNAAVRRVAPDGRAPCGMCRTRCPTRKHVLNLQIRVEHLLARDIGCAMLPRRIAEIHQASAGGGAAAQPPGRSAGKEPFRIREAGRIRICQVGYGRARGCGVGNHGPRDHRLHHAPGNRHLIKNRRAAGVAAHIKISAGIARRLIGAVECSVKSGAGAAALVPTTAFVLKARPAVMENWKTAEHGSVPAHNVVPSFEAKTYNCSAMPSTIGPSTMPAPWSIWADCVTFTKFGFRE